MTQYVINQNFDNWQVREFLEYFKVSQKKINWIINDKKYRVNGEIKDVINTGDLLTFNDECFMENQVEPLYLELDVLFQDQYVLVVNKPKNLIIHSDDGETLDRIVAGYLVNNGMEPIPRHLYRLDKDTSGCMLYALDPLTLSKLSHDLENKKLTKTYLALVSGQMNNKNGIIDYKIASDRHVNGKMIVSKNGKSALTSYEVLKSNIKQSLLRVKIETGRTHQIRVHLSSIGYPIIGDEIYGKKSSLPLQLQAETVTFYHPFMKKSLTIKVRLPIQL